MLTVMLWNANDGDECLGSWYSEEHVQVPRRDDILWLETDEHRHGRWRVVNVQWSFSNRSLGITRLREMRAEVWITPYSTKPLWRRFIELFPKRADAVQNTE